MMVNCSTAITLYWCTWLSIILTIVSSSSQESCTQGFMDYELLSQKASQIGDPSSTNTVNGIGSNNGNRFYVMPGLRFTCSGTITGLLLAAEVRIEGSTIDDFPSIEVYNVITSNNYDFVSGSVRTIILGPDDFSTSGLYNYTLPSPLQYTSGQILGVHQTDTDESVVRLYYRQSHGTDDIQRVNSAGNVLNEAFSNSRLLLHPITDNPSCLSSGFISYKDLQESARLVTSVSGSYDSSLGTDRFFPDVKFTCSGSITHVVVGMNDSTGSIPPAIEIWRRNSNNPHHTQSGPTIPLRYSDAVSDISTDYLRWYNLSVPVPVQKGDVLGISNALNNRDAVIYYQQYSAPPNYYSVNGIDANTGFNIYPLVFVIVSGLEATTLSTKPTLSITETIASIETALPAQMTIPTKATLSAIDPAMSITIPSGISTLIADSVDIITSTQLPTPIAPSDSSTVAIVVPVVLIILLICIAVLVASIVGVVYYFRNKNNRNNKSSVAETTEQSVSHCKKMLFDFVCRNNLQREVKGDSSKDSTEDNTMTPNELYAAINKEPHRESVYESIDSSTDDGSDTAIEMKLNESYGKHHLQTPVYIEGMKHSVLLIEVNQSYGEHRPVYIEGRHEVPSTTESFYY